MDAYLDHGAYATNIGAAPTWGVPQEGDGSSKDAATAASVGSILMTAVPTSGTISVCGVSVSTTSVIGAASADAAANALATNINATSTAVASGVAIGTPQLRNLVYARGPSGGAPAGTCQIMMRVGSATLNYANNTNAAIATTFTGTPALTQFAGGSGGCWGWFVNTAAIGVSNSMSAYTYGLWLASPMVRYSGFAFAEFDVVNVRTGRNTTLSITSGAATGANKPTWVHMLFDSGAIWTGDSPTAKFTLDLAANPGSGYEFATANRFHGFKCKTLGAFTVTYSIGGTSTTPMTWAYDSGGTSTGWLHEKVSFIEKAGSNANSCLYFGNYSYPTKGTSALVDCLIDTSAVQRVNLGSSMIDFRLGAYSIIGCDFRWTLTGTGGAAFSVPFAKNINAGNALQIAMRGNKFSCGQAGDLTLFQQAVALGAGSTIMCENNKGGGFPAGSIGLTNTTVQPNNAALVFDNLGIGGSAKYETRQGYCDWTLGQPVLSSVSPDGTPWSWIAYWTNASWVINPSQPFLLPATRIQSRLATGVRTWTIEVLLDSVALTNLPSFGFVELQYVNAAGDPVSERVPVVLSASSAVWSNTVSAPYNTWVARKITGTTADSVKLNSIINVRLGMERPVNGGSTAAFAVDPEPSFT